jgi:hypothetical protein
MKKLIFTLIAAIAVQFCFSQTTYYWVGGTAPSSTSFNSSTLWNTQLGGGGTARSTPLATDILIIDGSDVSDVAGTQTGAIVFSFSSPTTNTGPAQLKIVNGADVTFKRSGSGGTTTLNIGVGNASDNDPDFVVSAGSKFRIAGLNGSLLVALDAVATAEIYGDIYMMENFNDGTTAYQSRLTAKGVRSFHFMAGSSLNTSTAYAYYPFGSSGSVVPAPYGVVFESGSVYNYGGGWSPFGGSSTNAVVEFKPGSKFYFHSTPVIPPSSTSTNMFTNRNYPDVIIDNNTTVTADGSLIGMDSLRIENGSTFITNVSGSTPIRNHIVNNGVFRVPAADPDRNNKIVLVNSGLQNISGTGTYTFADFIISNQSNVKLLKSVQVDSLTNIFGTLDATTNTVTGSGTTTVKAPASVNTTGKLVADSFVVTNIPDMTGIETGMSVTGTGIPANTVITNTNTAGTITLSKAITATTASQPLVIFNGQGVLPVKFTAFTAALDGAKVKLTWNIATEDNVSGYVIERSANGKEFSSIASLKAAQLNTYSAIDEQPIKGANFYRIKAVDNDGRSTYTSVIKISTSNTKAEVSINPNPIAGRSFMLNLNNFSNDTYTLTVLNEGGQKVYTQSLGRVNGSSNTSINLPQTVKAGMYHVVISSNDQQVIQRIIIQ